MRAEPKLPRWAAAYLLVQSAGIVLWWLGLFASTEGRGYFFKDRDWIPFVLPDMVLLVAGGVACAFAILQAPRSAPSLLCGLTGAALYATILDISYCAANGFPWIGPIFMAPTVLIPGYLCWKSLR
jgi:hypothetical protein